MNILEALKEKLKNGYFVVKVVFHILVFAMLIYAILFVYVYTKKDFLSGFIFVSDGFEGFTIILLTYLYYYRIARSERLMVHKLKWIVVCILILLVVAYNKEDYYVRTNGVRIDEIIGTLVMYIGFSSILLFVLWLLDQLYLLFNNRHLVSKKALDEAENRLLRQRFNPHFLFNAFNSLYSMSLQNHPRTSEIILKLSGMMRYLTDDTQIERVKLNKELQFIEQYIAIEKIRFGEHSNIQFMVEGDTSTKLIDPLLLIGFVENAFKHGFYTNNENAFVHIKTIVLNNWLEFNVTNSIDKKPFWEDEDRKGKGLELVKKRLQLSYPDTHSLELEEDVTVYRVKLKIELEQ